MRTRVGYTGGASLDPTYRNLGGHTEALQVDFDPQIVDYETVIALFWKAHDPSYLRPSSQYRAGVWCSDDEQLERTQAASQGLGLRIATPIERLETFYRAEDYHQKYSLRRQRALTEELIERYGSDRGMVDSTAAARLNGLLRGQGCLDDLERLLPTLCLSAASEELLTAQLRR